ncbi:MAG: CDP-diacylglycerol--glycerol-3-phosphate 3-phosphatidyltransferase [Ruaniaceae bacterium]|nr:CDP-diacylglycerol--glycerol-3-phosphate 3-phosphatidyltransferase [Ruaniaceae bacterium]
MGDDRPVEAPLWNIANVLTMIRMALVPVFVWLFLQGSDGTRLAATIVFSIAAITDKIDGDIARSRNLVTNFGKIADPIADKALVISAFVLLSSVGDMPWWVTIVIIVRELGITLLRFVMIRRSVMAASKGGKLKTVLQMTFIIGLLMPWQMFLPDGVASSLVTTSLVIMYAALGVTVVTGIQYCLDAWKLAQK